MIELFITCYKDYKETNLSTFPIMINAALRPRPQVAHIPNGRGNSMQTSKKFLSFFYNCMKEENYAQY